jgi:outer membrane protein
VGRVFPTALAQTVDGIPESIPFPEEQPGSVPPPSPERPDPEGEVRQDSTLEADSSTRIVPITLPELLNLTLQGNRDLRNDTLERIVQRQELNAAEQAFDPRFTPSLRLDVTQNLSASGTTVVDTGDELIRFNDATDVDQQALLTTTLTTRQGTDISVGVDPLDGTQPLRLRIEQPLLRGAGQAVNEAPVDQARLQETQNQLALRNTTINTLTQAIGQYTNLINTQSQVAIQTQALERRQQQLEIQRALVAAGRQAPVNVFETERSVADAERDLVIAQNQLQQANNDILNLIGTDQNLTFVASAETVEDLFASAAAQAAAYELEPLIALALQRRPDYRQAQLQQQQLELTQLLAEDNLRWQINAVADGNLGDFSRSALGVVATRTFDEPQLETARVRSEVSLQQQDNRLTQLQEQIRNDVTASLAEVQSNLLRVEAAERATVNADLQLEVAKEQFRLGREDVTQFQIITQEDDLVRAQNDALAARIAFLNSIAQLEQTVGITLDSWAEQVNLDPVLGDPMPEDGEASPDLPSESISEPIIED